MLQAASPLAGAGESLLHLSGPSASICQHQPCGRGFELVAGDEEVTDTPFVSRCFYIPHPSN